MILLRHGQSEFNVVYSVTRVDPGIIDPELTDVGHQQISDAAASLEAHDIRRIIASPYTRTLQSAQIVADRLDLPVEVEPIVRERCFFSCDIGSPRSELAERWPGFDFGVMEERWWPEPNETEEEIDARCRSFRAHMADTQGWRHVLVVSHWGFIRGLTGHEVGNAAIVPFDPTDPG